MAKIDDSVKKKVPELRFKGFTDEWEQRKFDECFNFPVSTNSLSRALLNYDEGDIKSVHYGDILIKYPAILNIKNDKIPYITGGKLEKYKSSLLENGDLIFADAAEDETVGKAVEVNGLTEENLVAGLHTIVARPKDKKAEFFLGYYINSNTYHRQLLRLIQGSKVSSISKGNLQKTLVSFPKDF
ncbi:restriction endonuclease subunit S, partial [Enterococcus faecalis]